MQPRHTKRSRTGGIYIAVLGTAMVVALLGLSAMFAQRMQNRMITAAADLRQAQLNANTAIELGLLAMKTDTNWRTTYAHGNWFVKRATSAGTCTLNVTDPADSNLANNADDPVVMLGIGYSGEAEQRVKVTIDPRKGPLSCLRSAIAIGDAATLSNDTLRTTGLITAGSISATSAQIYGKVEAIAASGSTYNSGTTIVTSQKRPTMPDWTSVFNYYKTNGTQIDINTLPTQTPNLGRNTGFETNVNDWSGTPTGIPTADISQSNNQARTGTYSLRVQNRNAWNAGAAQYIDAYVKPGQQYTISGYVYFTSGTFKNFRFTLFTKGTGSAVQQSNGADNWCVVNGWWPVTATVTAPTWTGNLEYAFIKISGADSNNTSDFFFDDLTIRETTTGRFIYRQVLSPSINPFGATTNSEGIYWINCNNNKLVIERSRILGTLLVINPGAGSCVSNGPIAWQPAVAGYPALLVDADTPDNADFAINATNRGLSEKENGVNFNPAGAAHDEFGQDADTNDIYRSNIRGLVAVRDDLSFANRALVRGQVIVGDDLINSSGELEVEYLRDSLLNPPPGFTAPYTYIRRPTSVQKAVLP